MPDNSHAIPVWAQILLALIAAIGTIVVAYINRPLPPAPSVQPSTPPPPASPSPTPNPEFVNPKPTRKAQSSAVLETDAADDGKQQTAIPDKKPRTSLQDMIGLDVAIGDDLALLKHSYPNIVWNQVQNVLLGEITGRFVNKVPGKITVRVEQNILTTVWFEMSSNGGTVRRTVESSDDSLDEKTRNEFDADYSYSQATNMCSVTDGLRSDIIKILGTAKRFDEKTAPSDINDENVKLKYVNFENFTAKYNIGETALANVKFISEAYVKNDRSSSGYINTKTSHRECSVALIVNRLK